jgi:hypothetical protein
LHGGGQNLDYKDYLEFLRTKFQKTDNQLSSNLEKSLERREIKIKIQLEPKEKVEDHIKSVSAQLNIKDEEVKEIEATTN